MRFVSNAYWKLLIGLLYEKRLKHANFILFLTNFVCMVHKACLKMLSCYNMFVAWFLTHEKVGLEHMNIRWLLLLKHWHEVTTFKRSRSKCWMVQYEKGVESCYQKLYYLKTFVKTNYFKLKTWIAEGNIVRL